MSLFGDFLELLLKNNVYGGLPLSVAAAGTSDV